MRSLDPSGSALRHPTDQQKSWIVWGVISILFVVIISIAACTKAPAEEVVKFNPLTSPGTVKTVTRRESVDHVTLPENKATFSEDSSFASTETISTLP